MHYGFVFIGRANEMVEMAQEAESAGWDGVFVPDDWGASWIELTAMAMRTERIRLGTMLTALPQHQPWTTAAQTATLDQISGGRVILAVGLGVLELDKMGLPDNKVRAQMLDEGLELLNGWWSGQSMRSFTYHGRYYHMEEMTAQIQGLTQAPQQKPRIPIWVVGGEKQSQIRRAARWDGALMNGKPEEIRRRKAQIEALRTAMPLDIIVEGETPGDDPAQAAAIAQSYAEAGATWWIESMWDLEGVQRRYDMRTRIKMGPPRLH